MSRQIRTSAKAVIIQNGKLLAIKLNDGKEEWYILPGGGQDCEEMLPRTVEREVREEAGIRVKCKVLLFVIEGVHGESFHRMDLSVLNRLPLFPSSSKKRLILFLLSAHILPLCCAIMVSAMERPRPKAHFFVYSLRLKSLLLLSLLYILPVQS